MEAMPSFQSQLVELESIWEICRGEDERKHALITRLFEHVSRLNAQLLDTESELRDKTDLVKLKRATLDAADKEVKAMKDEKSRYAFVSVLIDGDCMPFRDDLLKQGCEGGKKAARLLKHDVEEYLRTAVPGAANNLTVLVHVYANVRGLGRAYKEAGVLEEASHLADFARGFNMGDAMCNYVDAGTGKECSDEKLKEIFRLHLNNVHCQHVIFGGSADNGYARLLEPFTEDALAAGRITMLEGPPFARELAVIKDKFFGTASFPGVFRSVKLVARRVSFHVTPPDTPAQGYAAVASRAPQATQTPFRRPGTPSQSAASPPENNSHRLGAVLRNKEGQRVDSYLRYTTAEFGIMKSRRLCNPFHILGKCPYESNYGKCQYEHDPKLDEKFLPALRAVARGSPCGEGLQCKEPDCILGHRCPREHCTPGSGCWFPLAMHNIDTKVVSL